MTDVLVQPQGGPQLHPPPRVIGTWQFTLRRDPRVEVVTETAIPRIPNAGPQVRVRREGHL
jgi:hypothetical protein